MRVGDKVTLSQDMPIEFGTSHNSDLPGDWMPTPVWIPAGATGTVKRVRAMALYDYQTIINGWGAAAPRTKWAEVGSAYAADLMARPGCVKDKAKEECDVVLDLGLIITIDSAILAPAAQAAPVVVVYTDANYGGASQTLLPGRYDMGDLTVPNDSISSIRVGKGLRVILFGDSGFTGGQTLIDADTALIKDGANDNATSIIIEKI